MNRRLFLFSLAGAAITGPAASASWMQPIKPIWVSAKEKCAYYTRNMPPDEAAALTARLLPNLPDEFMVEGRLAVRIRMWRFRGGGAWVVPEWLRDPWPDCAVAVEKLYECRPVNHAFREWAWQEWARQLA